jgi:hypothetical protein
LLTGEGGWDGGGAKSYDDEKAWSSINHSKLSDMLCCVHPISCVHYRYYEKVRDVRQNKGSILRASVEYIRLLKEDLSTKLQLDKLCRLQQYQNRKLLMQIQASKQLTSGRKKGF